VASTFEIESHKYPDAIRSKTMPNAMNILAGCMELATAPKIFWH